MNNATLFTRKPILNQKLKTVGYFIYFNKQPHFKTTSVVDDNHNDILSTIGVDINKISSGLPIFIDASQTSKNSKLIKLFPKKRVFLLFKDTDYLNFSNIETSTLAFFKKTGYKLALLVTNIATITKVDYNIFNFLFFDSISIDAVNLQIVASNFIDKDIILGTSKVDTKENFEELKDFGFQLFEGNFFQQPELISGTKLSPSKFTSIKILKEVLKKYINFNTIESIIKEDVALTYSLLKYINSAFFGLRNKVKSIRHAISLMGEAELKKWIYITFISQTTKDMPDEFAKTALIRAKFMESIAEYFNLKSESNNLFMLGTLSMADKILGESFNEVIKEFPLPTSIKNALKGEQNEYNKILKFTIYYENGKWDKITLYYSSLLSYNYNISQIYSDSIEWVTQILDNN